jgi:hypothetical protein
MDCKYGRVTSQNFAFSVFTEEREEKCCEEGTRLHTFFQRERTRDHFELNYVIDQRTKTYVPLDEIVAILKIFLVVHISKEG